MSILSFLKKQFIDVIEWNETENGVLAYRYPMQDNEIQNGGKLTVRETQMALFVNEGKIADLFAPGLHTLTTQTLPILTNLRNWDKAFASPFKSDVYFFSTRLQLDQKWGTPTPITIRDKELGPIRVRAYGIYSYKMTDPKLFWTQVSGSREIYRTADIEDQLRGVLLTTLASLFGQSNVNFLDMAANQLKFSETIAAAFAPELQRFGLSLDKLQVQSVSLPEEVQKVIDERSSMNVIGNLQQYTQYQAAKSIPIAAANPGGMAGAGVGLGAGVAMGQAMAQALGANPNVASATPQEDPFQLIEKIHQLKEKGIISTEEFETKKAELLKKI
ncbi:MAG: SPFH domain-containing protein [Deltaproteobacteria bacterium]|nr:SPFH domain-containing protein [Deltaproteobacteria bacterium]